MKIENIDKLNARIAKIPADIKEAARDQIAKGAKEIVARQKQLAPIDDGDLQESITWRWGNEANVKYSQKMGGSTWGKTELSAVITAGNSAVRYAHLVEFGARPHVIKSKSGGKLVFYEKGKLLRAASVNHPGAPQQPFFFPGWRMGKDKTQKALRAAWRRAIRGSMA